MMDEIQNTIVCYDEYYGISPNQEIILNICLKSGYFKPDNVESILNIFLFETFDNEECYLDSNREFLNEEYLTKHPEIIKEMIKDNVEYY